MEIINKKGKKKKVKKVKPTKEFTNFLKKLELKTPQEAKVLINAYTAKANESAEYSDNILSYAKALVKKAIIKDKKELEKKLKEITSEKVKTPSFSIETIKELEAVEDCFMEDEKLIIITKEQKRTTYKTKDGGHKVDWEYTMPAYRIEYLSTNQSITSYRKTVPTDYQINPKETKLGYKVILLKDKDIEMLGSAKELMRNETFEVPGLPGASGNPYQVGVSNYNKTQGGGEVCFGGSASMQQQHIRDNEILPHAINMLKTLYTGDYRGAGHSNWINIIIRNETIKKTIKLKDTIGEFEGCFHLSSEIYGRGDVDSNIKFKPSDGIYENPIKLKANKYTKTNIKKLLDEHDYKDIKIDSYDLSITNIGLEQATNLKTNNGISSMSTTLKLMVKDKLIGYLDVIWRKEDIEKLGVIITPNGEFKMKEFNKFLKDIYEVDITPSN